jgi:hypothetical protein
LTSVPVHPAWSRWMCVSRIWRTSAMPIPLRSSVDRSVARLVDGPGSIRATPPGPWSTAVAMMFG